jgi:hypothetical protein
MDTSPSLSRSDYVGTLVVNLMRLRDLDSKAYLRLSSEWLGMQDTASIEEIVELEQRVIRACDVASLRTSLLETQTCMVMVDYHIRLIRENVDQMRALADDEIANILSRLDVFEQEFRRQSDYLRPDLEEN